MTRSLMPRSLVHRRLSIVLAFAGFLAASSAFAGDVVGVRLIKVPAPERGTDLDVTVWYPAEPGGTEISVGENAIFKGEPAFSGAPSDGKRHPLVLLSHGGGGSVARFAWVASRLVAAGYVVAGPNHPGSTSDNSAPAEAVKLWLRASDMSAVLTGIETDPLLGASIEGAKVAMLGFSAGGYTALALAGARIDPESLADFCDAGDHGMSDCAWFRRGGLDLHRIDLTPAGRDNRDARIKAIVVADPGLVETLTPESLKSIDIPVAIFNQGRPETVPSAVAAVQIAALIKGATLEYYPDAIHFSFLPDCKPGAEAILAAEAEPDPLCKDGQGRSRDAIHSDMAAKIVAAFKKVF